MHSQDTCIPSQEIPMEYYIETQEKNLLLTSLETCVSHSSSYVWLTEITHYIIFVITSDYRDTRTNNCLPEEVNERYCVSKDMNKSREQERASMKTGVQNQEKRSFAFHYLFYDNNVFFSKKHKRISWNSIHSNFIQVSFLYKNWLVNQTNRQEIAQKKSHVKVLEKRSYQGLKVSRLRKEMAKRNDKRSKTEAKGHKEVILVCLSLSVSFFISLSLFLFLSAVFWYVMKFNSHREWL